MVVIILVGLARSGKDTVADYIINKYNLVKYTFSDILKEQLEKKEITATKERMLELGDLLRQQMGMNAVAQLLDKKIIEKDNLVLVGPRSIEEIEYFKQKFSNIKIIKVVAGKDERFERKIEKNQSENKFFERDKKDLKTKGLQKVLDTAELQINNFETKEDLQKEIDTVMQFVI